jgi:hypothetical protein
MYSESLLHVCLCPVAASRRPGVPRPGVRRRPARLDGGGNKGPAGPAVPRPALPRTDSAPSVFRPARGAGFHPAVDQDRRLPRGLRLLPTSPAVRYGRRGQSDNAGRRRAGACPGGKGRRRLPVLHGRGLAVAEGPRPGRCLRHGRGRALARHGDLRDAGHADRAAGQAAEAGRAGLL